MSASNGGGIGRRDTLRLASAAAALGAGLGVVLRASDAVAQPRVAPNPAPTPLPPAPPPPPPPPPHVVGQQQIKIDGVQQHKIDTYQRLVPTKNTVVVKLSTMAGQLLYAATVPEEIAQLLFGVPNGQLQFKFFRATTTGQEPFKEGLMQFVPSNPAPTPELKPVAKPGSKP